MSVDIKQTRKNSKNDASSSSSASGATATLTFASSAYETKTLLCKNNCGYYGNSMQYDGYCSICYRRLKSKQQQSDQLSYMSSSASFDDSASLLSSQTFNNQLYSDK